VTRVAWTWGSTPAERREVFPCDQLLPDATDALFRATTVRAPPAGAFRWLCQLRVAPYSYDWLDNLGRPSPRHLTPGLEHLAVGQRVMTIFELAAFEPDRHLTLWMLGTRARAIFGDIAVSYTVRPIAPASSRFVVKLAMRHRHTVWHALMRRLLPWGDLIMMRRQLLTLAGLAERATTTDSPH
jgi:hypothetical protein